MGWAVRSSGGIGYWVLRFVGVACYLFSIYIIRCVILEWVIPMIIISKFSFFVFFCVFFGFFVWVVVI